MKKLKIILAVVLSLAVIVLPVVALFTAVWAIPPQFSNRFDGELNEKYDRLTSVKGEKVVFVGGSSVAFGLDSALVEKYTGMEVVNFGMYAALGTKVMLDLSRDAIGKGDVVVLSPEMDPQTLSLFFSSEETLMAIDDELSMFWKLPIDNQWNMVGSMWRHLVNKYRYWKEGAPDPEGVYNARNFNEYGDLQYPRPSNIMTFYYDPTTVIDLSPFIVDREFVDYLNDYIKVCQRRGATVVFNYCPMNEMALAEGSTEESRAAFDAYLRENIRCEFLTDIETPIMEAGYFYDSNFHLNDYGVRANTVRITGDLLSVLGIPATVQEQVPPPPALTLADPNFEGTDGNAVYFTYAPLPGGGYTVTGLTEEGRALSVLTLPRGTDGQKVFAVSEGAFAGSAATDIVIPEDSYITNLYNGAFDGAERLNDVWIGITDPALIKPPKPFCTGRNPRVHIPADSDYASDYFWCEVGIPAERFIGDAENAPS